MRAPGRAPDVRIPDPEHPADPVEAHRNVAPRFKRAPDAQAMADAVFAQLDTDKNGTLSFDEVKAFVATKKEIKCEGLLRLIFDAVDGDGNGEIDAAEFGKFFEAVKGIDPASKTAGLEVLFRLIDVNGDGKLSKAEVEAFFGKHKSECFDAAKFMAADADGDGEVTLDELIKHYA